MAIGFPISRDPPEGGTPTLITMSSAGSPFPISRNPPEGGTMKYTVAEFLQDKGCEFPISRDPPEGGTPLFPYKGGVKNVPFPISRDPPEGGTCGPVTVLAVAGLPSVSNF